MTVNLDLDIVCDPLPPKAAGVYCDLGDCLNQAQMILRDREGYPDWCLCSRHAEMLEDQLVKFRQAREGKTGESGGRP